MLQLLPCSPECALNSKEGGALTSADILYDLDFLD